MLEITDFKQYGQNYYIIPNLKTDKNRREKQSLVTKIIELLVLKS